MRPPLIVEKDLSRAEWADVHSAFGTIGGAVHLYIDGFHVTYHRRLIGKKRFGFMTYVDGQYSRKWMINDPRVYKFMRPKVLFGQYFSGERKQLVNDGVFLPLNKPEAYSPFWGTLDHLKHYLRAHNKSIELLSVSCVVV